MDVETRHVASSDEAPKAACRVSTSRRAFLMSAASCALGLSAGCRRTLPGTAELPPGITKAEGLFQDIAPRWSHDGKQIAFLRRTTDRRYQLFVASPDLSNPRPLLEPELINPDRPFRSGLSGTHAPERLEWSPDDRQIIFSRSEWFTFDDGQKMPGTGLWICDVRARTAQPLAVHKKDYEGSFYYFRSPQWSPDARRVAFIGEGVNGESALFVREMPAESAVFDKPRFDQYEDVDWPVWSPDGKRLLFRQGILRAFTADGVETLRVISPGGTEARSLLEITPVSFEAALNAATTRTSDDPSPLPDVAPRICGAGWSPTEEEFVVALTPGASPPETSSVWVIKSGEPLPKRSASPWDGRSYFAPVWAKKGTIAALRTAGEGYEVVELRRHNSGLPAVPRILCKLPSDNFDWSPSQQHIVCSIPTNGRPSAPTTLRVFQTGF
jgi:hypothetical protein